MKRAPSILEVMAELFGSVFRSGSWDAWRALLAAIFALPMDGAQLEIYRRCTGRENPPREKAREAWLVVGRRGGKSRIAALVAVFIACLVKHPLAPGETGVVMVIAADRRQARVVLRYVLALLRAVPMLERLIAAEQKESVELLNGIAIEVHTASFRSTRGYTVIAAILDEVAVWPTDDSAEPDAEIIAAVRPGMATIPSALLLGISSPYARRGELWKAYQRHFGKEGDPVIVWQADSRTMNPSLPEHVVADAYVEDEARASAEYGAQFRRDVEALFAVEALEAVIVRGRRELPPAVGVRYRAFADPSGGSSDSMTLAIAHEAGERRVLDLVREVRPPFSPEAVVEQFAELLRAYGIAEVAGDRYGGEWPAERFRKAGIAYRISEATKSEIYGAFLPVVTSGRVELLDDERLLRQLQRLERRTARGGRDSIDHPPGSHDDLANACAGALGLLGRVGGGANLIEYYRRLNEKLRHEEAAAAQPVPVLGPHVPTVGELAAEAAARSDPQPGVVVPATTAEPVKRSSNFAEAAVLQGRSGEPEPMRPRALPSTYRDGNSVVTRYGSPDGGDGKRRRRVAGFSGERS